MKTFEFLEVITDITAKFSKIQSTEFQASGKFAIVDQGKQLIAGYTDNEDLVTFDRFPLIIFGDHTKVFKFIEMPIALGADGTKALWVNLQIAHPKYVFFYLRSIKLTDAGYSRHFKFLKEIKIPCRLCKTRFALRICWKRSKA